MEHKLAHVFEVLLIIWLLWRTTRLIRHTNELCFGFNVMYGKFLELEEKINLTTQRWKHSFRLSGEK